MGVGLWEVISALGFDPGLFRGNRYTVVAAKPTFP